MSSARNYPGLALTTRKQLSRTQAIQVAAAPDELVLPLNQHGGRMLHACVQPGDHVLMGQIVAYADDALDAVLHSPVSGRVSAIESRASAKPVSDAALSIVISNDHADTPHAGCQPLAEWSSLSSFELCLHLARGGIAGLGGAVFSTASKQAAHRQQPIETLVINGAECEPYITCDDRLMCERASDILLGVRVLLHASQATRALIAIETDKPEAIAALRAALQSIADTRIQIHELPPEYPSGDEGQLIANLLGREIPRNGLPADIGVVVQNVATAYACARWVLQGQPLISRVVTITGTGIARPANLEVRIGSSMEYLLSLCGGVRPDSAQLVMGGAMMGVSLRDPHRPITKASNCLIVATETELPSRPPEQPCIRCGECMHACPVGLLPQQLLLHARHGHHAALGELGLRDCIECGCCDYVCPSHIRLASAFHQAKSLLSSQQ